MQDSRTGWEFGTGSRVGRMFPVDNLYLPLVAPIFIAVAAVVPSIPSLVLWHARLDYASSSRLGHASSIPSKIGRAHV